MNSCIPCECILLTYDPISQSKNCFCGAKASHIIILVCATSIYSEMFTSDNIEDLLSFSLTFTFIEQKYQHFHCFLPIKDWQPNEHRTFKTALSFGYNLLLLCLGPLLSLAKSKTKQIILMSRVLLPLSGTSHICSARPVLL